MPDQPDSCGTLFPFLSEWRAAKKRPGEGGLFAKEAFHDLEPSYQTRYISEDKEKVTMQMVTCIMEMGCIFARLTDDIVKGNVNFAPPSPDLQAHTQAVMERDYWKDQYSNLKKKHNKRLSDLIEAGRSSTFDQGGRETKRGVGREDPEVGGTRQMPSR